MLRRRLDRSGVEAGARPGASKMPRAHSGGWGKHRGEGWGKPPVHFPPLLFGFFVLDRPTRTAPAVRERTGATPPF